VEKGRNGRVSVSALWCKSRSTYLPFPSVILTIHCSPIGWCGVTCAILLCVIDMAEVNVEGAKDGQWKAVTFKTINLRCRSHVRMRSG